MVAGIVLFALGLKKTVEHVEEPLETVPAAATLWGVAIYLLAHIALSCRGIHRISYERLACAAILVALLPLAIRVPAIATLAIVASLLSALLVIETLHFAGLRERMRHPIRSCPDQESVNVHGEPGAVLEERAVRRVPVDLETRLGDEAGQ